MPIIDAPVYLVSGADAPERRKISASVFDLVEFLYDVPQPARYLLDSGDSTKS